MKIWVLPSVYMMNLGVNSVLVSIFDHKEKKRKDTYCDGRGKIFNFMNKFVHESLLILPSIILIFFCKLKIFALFEELPQNNNL